MTSQYPESTALDHTGHTVVGEPAHQNEPATIIYEDYWGTDSTTRYMMPDGHQWFEIKKMSEGNRAQYQREAGLQMTSQRKTGDTKIDIDQAQDRLALILNSVIAWNIVKKTGVNDFTPILFNRQALRQWVNETNPNYVDNLIQEIRKFNPFLQEDLSVEDLEKQEAEVRELLILARQRAAAADFSKNK